MDSNRNLEEGGRQPPGGIVCSGLVGDLALEVVFNRRVNWIHTITTFVFLATSLLLA